MEYCDVARRLLHKEILCTDCPIANECPLLILEDALGEAIPKSVEAMIKAVKKGGGKW